MSIRNCQPLPRDTTWGTHPQASDFIDKAVKRLGLLGLIAAAAVPVLHYGVRAVIPPEILQANPVPPASTIGMMIVVISGVMIYGLTASRAVNPELLLDIGLFFEVLGAFCIGLMEAPQLSAYTMDAVKGPGIALWITLFVLVVPNSLGKTALAALSSAAMGPITLVVAAYASHQLPPAPYLLAVISIYNIVGAVIAIILSRFVYNLGTDASKAREMGSYKLVELLGRGGMGEVWRAEHRLLARPAAIKLIQANVLGLSDSRATATVKKRFEREAQATAMLTSPHTIHLYDFGLTEEGAFYYVMELLRGIDLQTLVDRYGPVPAERAASFLSQICSSLDEAHQTGLVHRDIKPANIYVSKYGLEYDFVKVLDFGIARAREDSDAKLTLTNASVATGTPGFMAPEMVLGHDVDARADIYALGCVGYWLLTGRLVFEEETPLATMLAHAHKQPVPLSQRTEMEIPRQLESLIMSCLAKEPNRRPASAREIRKAILQQEFAVSWTADRAEDWWRLHMPEQAAAGTRSEKAERMVRADARAN